MNSNTSVKKKIIAGLMLTTVALSAAAVTVNVPNFLHSTTASAEVIANDTSARSITIHKYAIDNLADLGISGDGKVADKTLQDKLDKLDVIENVQFKITKVTGTNLTNPAKDSYTEDTTFTPVTLKTDAKGELKFDLGTGKAADGTYLIEELDSPDATHAVKRKASPFFVHVPMTDRDTNGDLMYDINVYPKNEVQHPLNPTKTIDGQAGESLLAGSVFQWEAAVDINPSDFYFVASQDSTIPGSNPAIHVNKGDKVYMDYFKIYDKLNASTELLGTKVQVFDGKDWTDLDSKTDYTFTKGAATMSPAGENEVSLTQAGMEKVAGISGAKKLRVVYQSKVIDPKFNGVIDNEFTVNKKEPGLTPDTETNPNKPKLFTGGFDIEKKAEDTKDVLKGAEFRIATSEQNAKDGIYLATDGKSYAESALPTGVDFLTSTSDDAGHAAFDGLPLTWYDDTNNNGKQDDSEPTFSDDKIERDYFVVETKAPAGYELLKDPQKVTVNLTTADDKAIEADITDKPKTELPFTGGTGTMLLITVAVGAIGIGTAAVVMDKKRRQEAESLTK
ncbi:SpaH/EbpB family LPXTG-anchored major pilin [Pseudolactococcus chungangensis]|uniref:SpaH/EbpB family LPXTG-anchored major pilin n=1 Tax=Pseudolactococcus chungangensis TaxID=451457 RepID=UPI0028D61894|nr:SpaH/EbpB family LPXTG-anchored major pilin [Lactococcus chungangensis]